MKKILLIIAAIASVGLAVYAFEVASTHLDAEEFRFAKSSYSRWEDVFEKAPAVKLDIIRTGEINAPLSGALNLSRPEAKGINDQPKRIPAMAILITRGDKQYKVCPEARRHSGLHRRAGLF